MAIIRQVNVHFGLAIFFGLGSKSAPTTTGSHRPHPILFGRIFRGPKIILCDVTSSVGYRAIQILAAIQRDRVWCAIRNASGDRQSHRVSSTFPYSSTRVVFKGLDLVTEGAATSSILSS
ncbi:hypothetical protein B0H63DRAFT_447650 [Podospora didyma]|uniref:Uncharacterized protein n=1 Tax=Podospora didyma TaxID=330526 RepID=A0AAE0U161_9PEZI|nr:hypothetical protein B0H63DRAFT_447650 [Podospora didyma]